MSSDIKIEALAPKDDLSAEKDPVFKVYNDSLNNAFENPQIRNLALSGSLGSGKSSIIRSFDRKRNGEKHFLYISLIDFSKAATVADAKPYDQRQLEYSLLNQILSYCRSDDIPEGTICGIPEKFEFLDSYAKSLTLLFLSVFVLIFHEKFGALAAMFGLPGYLRSNIHLMLYLFVAVALCGCVYRILSRCLPFLRVSKLLLKSNVAEAEVNLGKERTTLDAHKFELAYILEQIGEKHDYTVVFEDLERLDPGTAIDIMGKLRELNTLTNNHLQTQVKTDFHPIRFLYAISDSTMPAEYRTKFYDCIIPVVPVSHPLNSREQFIKILNELGLGSEWNDKLSDALSDAFADYRTLLSLRNEFQVLRALCKAVSGNESTQCSNVSTESAASCNEAFLFAITAYKILLPEWFEHALSPQGDGILPNFSSEQERKDLEEYLTQQNRTKSIAAVQKLFTNNLLDKASMRLIIGERALIEQWMKIIRSALDQDTFDKGEEVRITKVTEAMASVLKNYTPDPTQEPYADFRKAMTERLCKLTSEKQEAHFILVINSLSAVSGGYVAKDWPKVIRELMEEPADFSGFLRNYICWLVDLSLLQELPERTVTISNLKSLCEAYSECKEITQEYANHLFELSCNQTLSELPDTNSRLKIICEAIPEYQGIAEKQANRLFRQSCDQKLPKRIDTINRLSILCEAYHGNQEIAQQYAMGLLYLSRAQQLPERIDTLNKFKLLCDIYPENREITLAYAKGLFELTRVQDESLIPGIVTDLATCLQRCNSVIPEFNHTLTGYLSKHPEHTERYQQLLRLIDTSEITSC